MIVITIDNKEYNVKNKLSEFTLGELELVNNVFGEGKSIVDKWVNVISVLTGLSKDRIMDLPHKQFVELMDMMFKSDVPYERLKEVELKGKIYTSKDEPSARDIAIVERLFGEKHPHQLSIIIASQFVCEGESNDFESLEKRAELMRELPAQNLIQFAFAGVLNFLEFASLANVTADDNVKSA